MNHLPLFICGSVAYDYVYQYNDQFSKNILPDQLHQLNVCFLVPRMQRHFGGCAGNIAYGLKQLGMHSFIVASSGQDFDDYEHYLEKLNLSQTYICKQTDTFTAQALIINDQAQNQLTFFHPGALDFAHQHSINFTQASQGYTNTTGFAIVSPDGKLAMQRYVQEAKQAGLQTIFDPGQMLPTFSSDELQQALSFSDYLIVNQYESLLIEQSLNCSIAELVKQHTNIQAILVTDGEKGATIYGANTSMFIPTIAAAHVVDPTGCGDAFRAGLLYGLMQQLNLEQAVSIGHIMGGAKIASAGGQNYSLNEAQIHAIQNLSSAYAL